MAPKVRPGDRVIIEISSQEVFEGTVEYMSSESIELYNIYCQTTDVNYEGSMTFYRDEVVSLSLISDTDDSTASGDESKKIRLSSQEFTRLKEMTFQFMFIDMFDQRFKGAVEVLGDRESVAVVGLGNTSKRENLSLLLLSDFKQVYVFDMFCLVDLRGLRTILESQFICKVVHDGAALFDCLYHKYGVEMRNVFDTQIVDSMLAKKEENIEIKRNISECLAHHFNFPLALLSAVVDEMSDKDWLERPVTKSNKIKAAQLVTYLLTLRDHLMGTILKDYTTNIQKLYNKYKKISLTETLTLNRMKD